MKPPKTVTEKQQDFSRLCLSIGTSLQEMREKDKCPESVTVSPTKKKGKKK